MGGRRVVLCSDGGPAVTEPGARQGRATANPLTPVAREIVGATAVLAGLTWLGVKVAEFNGGAAPIWPATGLAIWWVLRGGRRMLLAVILGAILGKWAAGAPSTSWLAGALGSSAEAWVGAWVVQRGFAQAKRWGNLARVAGYVMAALIAPVASVVIGVGMLQVTGSIAVLGWAKLAVAWWFGDMLGALFLAPMFCVRREVSGDAVATTPTHWRWGTGAILVTLLVCWGVFFHPMGRAYIFAVYPLLLLGVLWRFRDGALWIALLVLILAIASWLGGMGVFAGSVTRNGLLLLQAYLVCIGFTALVLPLLRQRGGLRLPATVLLVGWSVSTTVYQSQRATMEAADQAHLQAEVENAEAALRERMTLYIEALRAGEALFNTVDWVSRAQWRSFSGELRLPERFPGIHGIGAIWPISADRVGWFEEKMRADGSADFRVRPVADAEPPLTGDGAPESYVIGYLEPEASNGPAIGLDVGSEVKRRRAADAARDSGEARMTRRIVLVQDGKRRAGFLLFMPVYDLGAPLTTVAERRAAFRQWVYAPFVTELFVHNVLPGVTQELVLDLFEGESTAPEDLVYSGELFAAENVALEPVDEETYAQVTRFELAGETFTMGWHKTVRFVSPDGSTPVWIGSALALLTLALAAIITLLHRSSKRATSMVAERTRELAAAQRDLEQVVRFQRGVLDGSPFAMISTTPDGVIQIFSAEAERMLGYSKDEVVGKMSPAPFHLGPEVARRAVELSEELGVLIEPGFGTFVARVEHGRRDEREWTYVRKDGSHVPVLLTISAICDAKGKTVGYLGIAQDLTERHQADLERRRAIDELSALKYALDQHVEMSISDLNGTIVYANDKFCANAGYLRSELVGCNHRQLKSGEHPARFFEDMWTTILSGRSWRGTVKNRTKSGSFYWVDTLIIPELDGDGRPRRFVSIRTDVTDRKELEYNLAKARDEALSLSRLKSQFLANMSHELRTPMNGVIGMVGLLAETRLDGEQRRMTDVIRNSGESLLKIISDVLDFSKIEAGKMRMDPVDFSLPDIVREVVDLLSSMAAGKGIELRCEMPDYRWEALRGDGGRLRQVVINLLGNAVKFTDDGTVSLVLQVLRQDDGRLAFKVSVKDTGRGIAPALRARLFQPFVQADGSDSRVFGGTGLGLAISRQIIEFMGGRIGCESEEGRGSTFWFELSLPLAASSSPLESTREESATREAAEVPADPVERARGAGGRAVLLVEDNPTNQEVARIMLQRMGHAVQIAENGRQALERLAAQDFDVVFMDCQMPVMNGYEATTRIRAGEVPGGNPAIPIIALTAYVMPSDRKRCLDAGMDHYLTKPLRGKEVAAVLDLVFRDRPTEAKPSATKGGVGSAPVDESPARSRAASPEVLSDAVAAELEDLPGDAGGTVFSEVVVSFFQTSDQELARLGALFKAGNWADLALRAHRFGGGAATFGGVALRTSSLALERAAKAADPVAAKTLLERVECDCDDLQVAALFRISKRPSDPTAIRN